MDVERDFNDVLDDIFVHEETSHKNSYEEGFKAGKEAGNPEGYHLGYHRGAELGRELGFYLATVTHHMNINENSETKYSNKILNQLSKVKELIDSFPRTNSEDHDILDMAEKIRAQYKKTCSLLKIPSNNPYDASILTTQMDPTMLKLRNHIDSLLSYLTPLLPLANCHMVEFLTQNHWDTLLPTDLRTCLNKMDIEEAVEKFWSAQNVCNDKSALGLWVRTARSHCLTVNNDYCLSIEQLEKHIKERGGVLPPEIPVKEFMNPKKSYEVRIMSRLLSSLHHMVEATCSLEAGGGRGHLLVTASHGYHLRCLTVDCDQTSLASAEARGRLIQKQWHAISNGSRGQSGLHRFAELFVTEHTDLADVVKDKFPEIANEDIKVLLTGLHTCGDLGPSSLRIFLTQPSTRAVFNVPCCYHLLTEAITSGFLFDDQECERREGFPMSEHLRGFTLGRNARMLAAQSLERVTSQRQLPARSLLYRALLQAIIKEHKPDFVLAEGRLKRVGAKSQNFEEYFKMADSILKLELFDSLPANYLTEVNSQWKNMVLFYLIRLCLAQVIESLILLDRLLFLKENGFNNTFLVKLFDPVLSPRCHSIVAIR